jgi:hypothetical protein
MMWLSDETLLDLRIDPMQPPFRLAASLLIKPNLGLQFCNSTFGGAKLIRKLLGYLEMAPVKRYAASGCVKAASNWSSAQSISSRVITSGGLTRMVWSWVSLHRRPRRRRASQ